METPDPRPSDHELFLLAPTWPNVDRVFHILWGEASTGIYRKTTWAAFQQLLLATRASTLEG